MSLVSLGNLQENTNPTVIFKDSENQSKIRRDYNSLQI